MVGLFQVDDGEHAVHHLEDQGGLVEREAFVRGFFREAVFSEGLYVHGFVNENECCGLYSLLPYRRQEGVLDVGDVERRFRSYYRHDIEADGNWFHVIIGDHAYGKYICIPNWNIGTELAGLSDHFWNSERLHLAGVSKTRSRILADALAEISRHQEKTERNAVEKEECWNCRRRS